MVGIGEIVYYALHFHELRAIVQWKVWHVPVHQRDKEKESESLKICFNLQDLTSRSFSAVIQELHPELLVPVAMFYLILRGLDTIEDDMTIPIEKKEPLLRNFHNIIEKEGWNFDGNGPNEKDRELLVQFQNVVEEFRKVKPEYREVIRDITHKMGDGMADFAKDEEHNTNGVTTVKDYDLYCHYVAGLVGEGVTRLFVGSGLANKALLDRPNLHESMGLFLQKTNIIRDIREDFDDKRAFWPKEIWSKYVDELGDLFDPKYATEALNCSSEMVLNALNHADECLYYLAGLKEQSVFNFAAIPQAMAIATLALVFRNPAVFKKNVKITKGEACSIMNQSTQNLRALCNVFTIYTRQIRKKNNSRDPNFLKISIACGKIEQFIESLFPSDIPEALVQEQAGQSAPEPTPAVARLIEQTAREKQAAEEAKWDTIYMLIAVMGSLFTLSCIMLFVAYLFGARFDIAIKELMKGRISRPDPRTAEEIIRKYDHGDL